MTTKQPAMHIDVCVATYKRPELLEKLLESVFAQRTEQDFTYGIIVIDNDKDGSARSTLNRFQGKGLDIHYDIEPEKNIALSRNRAITLGTGDLIATIDDDEIADEYWLWHLFDTLNQYDADVVFGSVFPYYDAEPPSIIKEGGVFDLPNPPTGSTSGFVYNTSSSLFRREIVKSIPGPFNSRFGLTGGSDSYLFNMLYKRGHKLAWSQESKVQHLIPTDRANLLWLFKREFRYGNTHYAIWEKGPFFLNLPRWTEFLISVFCVPLFLVLSLVSGVASQAFPPLKGKAIWWYRRLAFYCGLTSFFFKYQFQEYNTS